MATGLITALVAIGVAQLVAGFTGPQFSPVVAVGGAAIDNAPAPVKNFAISTFGANDKRVLIAGILVVLAVFAALIGIAALRRLAFGLAGLAVFTLVGLLAALTRPDSSAIDALPVLLGAAAGAYTMTRLVRAASATERALSAPPPPATAGPPPLGATAAATDDTVSAGFWPTRRCGPPSPPARPGRRVFLITGQCRRDAGAPAQRLARALQRGAPRAPGPAAAGRIGPAYQRAEPVHYPERLLLPGGHLAHPARG